MSHPTPNHRPNPTPNSARNSGYAQTPSIETVVLKPCQDGRAEHHLIVADPTTTDALGLPAGALLHLDTRRSPKSGDVVLAEVVVQERLIRTLRRYNSVGPPGGRATVSLAPLAGRAGAPSVRQPGSSTASLIRPRYEVGIVGVVDGHIAPLAER